MSKPIGFTGPSSFTWELLTLIQEAFESDARLLTKTGWKSQLDGCGAVILAGGLDIHPKFSFKKLPKKLRGNWDEARDEQELGITAYCLEHNIPLLAVCRGQQIMGVHLGMQVVQDIPVIPVDHNPEKHQKMILLPGDTAHRMRLSVEIYPEEMKALGYISNFITTHYLGVNSWHHQGLRLNGQNGNKCKILGVADDGIIELMMGDRWIAPQFHPEFDWWKKKSSWGVVNLFKSWI